MKATFDLPDELYRSAKARSAMEGRPLRSVVIELFQNWLREARKNPEPAEQPTDEEMERYPWLAIARRYVRPGMSHDLDDIQEAAARGWGEDATGKLMQSEGERPGHG